jgi:hypothetical protein
MSSVKIDIKIGRTLFALAPNQLRAKYLQLLYKRETGVILELEELLLQRESDGHFVFAEGKDGVFVEASESNNVCWTVKSLSSSLKETGNKHPSTFAS